MPMLDVKDLSVHYGAIKALQEVNFHVDEGEIVALIGSNGAGKTTTLRTISGLERSCHGEILFYGTNICRTPSDKIVGMGIAHVPEGRRVFTNFTVLDNLKIAASLRKDRAAIKKDIDAVKKEPDGRNTQWWRAADARRRACHGNRRPADYDG